MKTTRLIGICTALMLSVLCIGSAQASIISDLVGYWSTDTNGDYKDYSNRAHTILNYGSSVFNTTGKVNGGYTYINGGVQTQAAQAGNTSDFEFGTGNYSIATWVKFNIDPAATATAIVSRLNYSSTNGFGLVVETSNFKFYQANYTLGTYIDSGINPVAGTWYFVAVVRNGTNTSIWINNTLAASATITQSASTTNTSKNLSIGGSDYGTWNKPSSATIDEIGLWKGYTLSAAEINCLYNSGTGRNYTQLATICQMGNFTIYQVNDYYNGTQILSYNATINGTLYSTTNGVINTNISSMENINVSLVANNYLGNVSMNWNASQALSAVLVPYTQIRASSYLGGSPGGILNFAINYTAYGNTSDTGTTTTTNGVAHIPLYNDVYNVRIYDANNASTNYGSTNASLTANTYLHSYNFTLYLSNTINLVFVDEINLSVINWSTMQFYLTGELFSYNGSTNNGTANFSLIQPDTYIITYYSNMYTTRNYVYSLQNQSQITIYLYARPIVNSTVVLITVNDQNTNAVTNATVYSRIKNLSSGDYYINEMCLTDNNGQCQITADVSTTTYKASTTYNFILYYRNVLVGSSGDTVLSGSTLNLRANVGSSQTTNYFQLMEVQFTNISFDNTTNTFSATVSDPYDNLATICLTTYRRTGSSTTQTNASCNTGSTATPSVSTDTSLGDENYAVLTGTYYNQTIIFDTSNGEVNSTAGTNYKAAYLIFVFLALIIVIFMGTKSLATTGMVFVAGIVIILAKVSSTILTQSILIGLIGMMVVIYLVMKVE